VRDMRGMDKPCYTATSTYLTGDASQITALLPDQHFAAVVTSPPYWARRRYTNDDAEIGVGALQTYLEELVGVFRALHPKLRDDGVMWVNIGDTATGSGGSGGDYVSGVRRNQPRYRQGSSGLAPMQWASVPHRFAHLMQQDGWLLRGEVIWDKGRRRPEDLRHARRFGESHEYVFMFVKSRRYGFDPEALTEKGSVWHIDPERSKTGHLAPMPLELAERCLAPVTAPGPVLDPFAGSGTTLLAAQAAGRCGVGVDLDPRNLEVARARGVDIHEDACIRCVRITRSKGEQVAHATSQKPHERR
jgi:site-specific DNA-methyltransferase (cytosine-N4-specific)